MLPYFSYKLNPFLNIKNNKKKDYSFLKSSILYVVYYSIPRILGVLFDLVLRNLRITQPKFVRSDCDHFGSWIFLLLCMNKLKNSNSIFFCLAKRDTINKSLLPYYAEFNLRIIYNPFLQIILSPFFFTKSNAIDVNGHFPLSYLKNNKSYPNFKSIGSIDDAFLDKASFKNNFKISKNSLFHDEKEFIIFYPRFGDWSYSIGNSRRNMSLKLAKNLLKIIPESLNIIMIGNTAKYFISDFNNLYSFEELVNKGEKIHDIYALAKCIVGSISGATHFPSLLYNLPTLYLGEIPLDHILAIYNLISSKPGDISSIPKKDKWVLFDFEAQDKIDNCFWEKILKDFVFNYKFEKSLELDSYFLESKSSYEKGTKPFNMRLSEKGNLYLHKSFPIR